MLNLTLLKREKSQLNVLVFPDFFKNCLSYSIGKIIPQIPKDEKELSV